jgi:hypothetical protein
MPDSHPPAAFFFQQLMGEFLNWLIFFFLTGREIKTPSNRRV